MGFLNIITGPIKGILDGAAGIIGKFVASPQEKAEAQLALMQLQVEFTEKMAACEAEFATQQAAVIQSEAKGESFLQRNWRPILMLTFTAIIAWNYMMVPIVGAFTSTLHPAEIPPDMWTLLKLGVTGYITGRSAEKIAETVIPAFAAGKK
jgi:hypothetical protein